MKKGEIVEAVCREMHYPNRGICECTDAPVSFVPADEHENNIISDERTDSVSSELMTEEIEEPFEIAVKNCIPGQKLSVRLLRKKGGIWHGQPLAVLEKSPFEDRPAGEVCPHAGQCGGCLFQTMSYKNTLALKQAEVRRLFEPVFSDDHTETFMRIYGGTLPSPDVTAYRNKMEFSFGDLEKDGPMTLGLHRRNSFYDIVTTDRCNIISADMRAVLAETLRFFTERGVSYYHKNEEAGFLRHLVVREGKNTGELLVDLVTTTQDPRHCVYSGDGSLSGTDLEKTSDEKSGDGSLSGTDLEKTSDGKSGDGSLPGTDLESDGFIEYLLKEWTQSLLSLRLCGKIVGILHTKNDAISDAVIDQGTEILYGSDSFTDTILGISFRISPFSFFQTNTRGAEKLYSVVRNMVTDTLAGQAGLIYDLYCGTGTITQLMAAVADRVIGVEIVPEAVEKARENAELNRIKNAEFICDDVFHALDSMPEKPDIMILDPPRDGVAKKALGKILSYKVENIVYVSCKPTSLARDIPAFHAAGYRAAKMVAVDMFPFTAQVEVVCLLEKNI